MTRDMMTARLDGGSLVILMALLAGCSLQFSFGNSATRNTQWTCGDIAAQTKQLRDAYKVQRDLATTQYERETLTRVVDGFTKEYLDLLVKDECWRKP